MFVGRWYPASVHRSLDASHLARGQLCSVATAAGLAVAKLNGHCKGAPRRRQRGQLLARLRQTLHDATQLVVQISPVEGAALAARSSLSPIGVVVTAPVAAITVAVARQVV